jgi:hypothetical protein
VTEIDIEKRFKPFLKNIEQYLIIEKLLGKSYEIRRREVWIYNNSDILYPAYTIELLNCKYDQSFEISINPDNEEIIIDFYIENFNYKKKDLYLYMKKLKEIKNNEIKLKYTNDYAFIYIMNNDSIIYDIIKLYFI